MKALFVMPHYSSCFEQSKRFLDEAIESIFNQDEGHWHLVIVDDQSCNDAVNYLRQLESLYPEQITVIYNTTNQGPGVCRNTGITFAAENGFEFVVFLDADDISHPSRVRVCRKLFGADESISVVYSTFTVIDENSLVVEQQKLRSSIKEILDSHKVPPQGQNAWIDMGTKSGYTNLTSSTAVRTSLALAHPFPSEKISEDMHTWFRYSAGGGSFCFTPEIPTLYRIPQNVQGSAARSREGGVDVFYRVKARVDEQGFKEALCIAESRGKIDHTMSPILLVQFYLKLANTFLKVQQVDLAMEQLSKANSVVGNLKAVAA